MVPSSAGDRVANSREQQFDDAFEAFLGEAASAPGDWYFAGEPPRDEEETAWRTGLGDMQRAHLFES